MPLTSIDIAIKKHIAKGDILISAYSHSNSYPQRHGLSIRVKITDDMNEIVKYLEKSGCVRMDNDHWALPALTFEEAQLSAKHLIGAKYQCPASDILGRQYCRYELRDRLEKLAESCSYSPGRILQVQDKHKANDASLAPFVKRYRAGEKITGDMLKQLFPGAYYRFKELLGEKYDLSGADWRLAGIAKSYNAPDLAAVGNTLGLHQQQAAFVRLAQSDEFTPNEEQKRLHTAAIDCALALQDHEREVFKYSVARDRDDGRTLRNDVTHTRINRKTCHKKLVTDGYIDAIGKPTSRKPER